MQAIKYHKKETCEIVRFEKVSVKIKHENYVIQGMTSTNLLE